MAKHDKVELQRKPLIVRSIHSLRTGADLATWRLAALDRQDWTGLQGARREVASWYQRIIVENLREIKRRQIHG